MWHFYLDSAERSDDHSKSEVRYYKYNKGAKLSNSKALIKQSNQLSPLTLNNNSIFNAKINAERFSNQYKKFNDKLNTIMPLSDQYLLKASIDQQIKPKYSKNGSNSWNSSRLYENENQ